MDLDVNNYHVTDLMKILDISNDKPNETDIYTKTNKFIQRFQKEGKYDLVKFFQDMHDVFRDFFHEQIVEGFESQTQDSSKNPSALSSLNEHKSIINTQPYSIGDITKKESVHNVSVSQGVLNPTLKNTTQQMINLDSQFRMATDTNNSDSNFTIRLSDSLKNVLNIKLYTIQIPYNWYVVYTTYGNTCFWVRIFNGSITDFINVRVYIDSGNYTPVQLVTQLNDRIFNEGIAKQKVCGLQK